MKTPNPSIEGKSKSYAFVFPSCQTLERSREFEELVRETPVLLQSPHSIQAKSKQFVFNRRPIKEAFFGQAVNGASRSWFCQSMACASRS